MMIQNVFLEHGQWYMQTRQGRKTVESKCLLMLSLIVEYNGVGAGAEAGTGQSKFVLYA